MNRTGLEEICSLARGAKMNRRLLMGATVVGFGAAVNGRVGAMAQDGGTITVYSGRNEALIGPLLAQFQDRTGITLDVRYGGTSEMAATILEEGSNSPADVFLSQDAGALGAIQAEGRFALLPDMILERVDARFRSDDGMWVGLTGRARVAVFNTDDLSDNDLPASVEGFTDESWRGRIGWAPSNASFQSFVTAFRVLQGDDAAREWLEAMVANDAVVFEGNGPIVRAVADGELSAGLVNHYYLYALQKEENDSLPIANHFFAPDDVGSLVNISGIGILGTAPNSDGAEQLVEFLLGEEAQTYFADETSEYPMIEGVAPIADLVPLSELGSPEIDLSELSDLESTLSLLTELSIL
ncbi:iron ABC transporter substrate-binding protein [soil metagenome]